MYWYFIVKEIIAKSNFEMVSIRRDELRCIVCKIDCPVRLKREYPVIDVQYGRRWRLYLRINLLLAGYTVFNNTVDLFFFRVGFPPYLYIDASVIVKVTHNPMIENTHS